MKTGGSFRTAAGQIECNCGPLWSYRHKVDRRRREACKMSEGNKAVCRSEGLGWQFGEEKSKHAAWRG